MIAMNLICEILLAWALGGIITLLAFVKYFSHASGRRVYLGIFIGGPVLWLCSFFIFIVAFCGALLRPQRGLPSPKTIDQRGRGE